MKFLVINGPNMNMLGLRNPKIYGQETFEDLIARIQRHCTERGIVVDFFQSNHEGAIVDRIQEAMGKYDGIVINPAAYTHTSVAILDALEAVGIPTVEIHISDIKNREEFRHRDLISSACIATIMGLGTDGYLKAIDVLEREIKSIK